MSVLPHKVGILGGGQLARMLVNKAHGLGVRPFVFLSNPNDCARAVCADVVINDGTPETAKKFFSSVDLITIENEFVDLDWLEKSLQGRHVHPSIATLKQIQNKLHQKMSLMQAGIPCLDFVQVANKEQLVQAAKRFKKGLVLKRASHGYDGKGVFIFKRGEIENQQSGQDAWRAFWDENPDFTGYAEPFVPFKKELAVVIARSTKGDVMAFPTVETNQDGGICHWTVAPARVDRSVAKKAIAIGQQIIEAFDGVGVFGIEMFLLKDNQIVVNEIAPRVHNSGHWTQNGCLVDQFEQHLRAILGLPLLKTELSFPAVAMVNILGHRDGNLEAGASFDVKSPTGVLSENTWLHWYGKSGPIRGRKLGHINAGGTNHTLALKKAKAVRARLII